MIVSLLLVNRSAPNLSRRWETLRVRLPRCRKIHATALFVRFPQQAGHRKAAVAAARIFNYSIHLVFT